MPKRLVSPLGFASELLAPWRRKSSMKFGAKNIVLVVAVISLGGATRRTHFRSVGKNYNINYNSNTNTNFDLIRLFRTISEHFSGSEIKAPKPSCPGGQCAPQLYEHFAASFSSDQEEDEEDYFYDYIDEDINLFSTGTSVKERAGNLPITEGSDQIVKLIPISDDTKLKILKLDANKAEAPAFSADPLVNQSDQKISLDSISVERISLE